MAALLREYVEIESPSDDPGAVAALAQRVAATSTALGLAVELRAGARRRARAARAPAPARAPTMLLGHLDTVWPMGTLARGPCRSRATCCTARAATT